MTALEIREGLAKANNFLDSHHSPDAIIAIAVVETMRFVAEIAAQLAELNEGLRGMADQGSNHFQVKVSDQ
jgi:hypothetical protein